MFQLNKMSQLVTVNPEITVAEYEERLNDDGFTGGYFPLEGADLSLSFCLLERVTNLYFLKYGGIGALCAGGRVTTPSSKNFSTKIYPRAATGPDLRRVVVGSQGLCGRFCEVSMRLFPLPEKTLWGVVLVETKEAASRFLVRMIGHFIRPLFVKVVQKDEADQLARDLKLTEEQKLLVIFKLSNLSRMIEAEKEALNRLVEKEAVFGMGIYWAGSQKERDLLDQLVLNAESFHLMADEYPWFFGLAPSKKSLKIEGELKKYFNEHPC